MQYADSGSFRFIHLNILRTFVSDYELFVQHTKFMCNICKLIYPTVVIFFYIIAYVLVCKIIYGVGAAKGNFYLGLFK
jgi:hypothetical protein